MIQTGIPSCEGLFSPAAILQFVEIYGEKSIICTGEFVILCNVTKKTEILLLIMIVVYCNWINNPD